jgi:hypothetical protein
VEQAASNLLKDDSLSWHSLPITMACRARKKEAFFARNLKSVERMCSEVVLVSVFVPLSLLPRFSPMHLPWSIDRALLNLSVGAFLDTLFL